MWLQLSINGDPKQWLAMGARERENESRQNLAAKVVVEEPAVKKFRAVLVIADSIESLLSSAEIPNTAEFFESSRESSNCPMTGKVGKIIAKGSAKVVC